MLPRAVSRIVYVQPSGVASFSRSALSRSSSTATPSLSSNLRLSSRRFTTTTAANPPPPPPPASSTATASTTATAAAQSTGSAGGGGSSSSGAGKESFFKSDTWAKTVGTIGALANWSIPLAAISHIMSSKDPATTIDPVMTTSLAVYSLLFMRWAIAITPANYPLLVCHIANEAVQLTQLGRYAMAEKKPGVPKQPQNIPID